jgi:hypothetical protein
MVLFFVWINETGFKRQIFKKLSPKRTGASLLEGTRKKLLVRCKQVGW